MLDSESIILDLQLLRCIFFYYNLFYYELDTESSFSLFLPYKRGKGKHFRITPNNYENGSTMHT